MKINMMIIGAEIKRNSSKIGERDGIIQLTMVPLTTVKKTVPEFMQILNSNMESLMKNVQELEQYKTIHYISIGEWLDNKYRISSHITLEILPEVDIVEGK